jgi:hypothetical protein
MKLLEVVAGVLNLGGSAGTVLIARRAIMVVIVSSLVAAQLVGSARTANAAQCMEETGAQSVCAAIFGRVVWADGEPAGDGRIGLVANNSASDDSGAVIQVHTDPTGRYEATICPCEQLVAFLILEDGGSCLVPLTAATATVPQAEVGSTANGIPVHAGGQVSWIVSGGHCGIADL